MAAKSVLSSQLPRIRSFSFSHRHFNVGRTIYNKPTTDSTSSIEGNVAGLSSNVLSTPSGPVGPGASKDSPKYKNPEYFCYHTMSYHEAEIEMLKYRCPQPSSKKAN